MFRPAFLTLLKNLEGFREKPYVCPGGSLTIGYGHVVQARETYEHLTEEEAEVLLRQDLHKTLRSLERLILVPLLLYQQEALLSFTYNVGAGALQRSTLRQCVNREDHDRVPQELARWVFAGGRKRPGLIHRRHLEGLWYQGSHPSVSSRA